MKPVETEELDSQTTRRIMAATGLICAAVVVMLAFFLKVVYKGAEMESQLRATPPPLTSHDSLENPPEEYFLEITVEEKFLLNEGELEPKDFAPIFSKMARDATEMKTTVLVTILAWERAPYGCIVDAMDALKRAGISNVTFAIQDGDF